MRIGIFGGTFNPPHVGHLNSLLELQKKAGLDKILMIPAHQNPLKSPLQGATPGQRLQMTKLATESWGPQFEVSDLEIARGGASYTVQTLKELASQNPHDELYLILGMDKFEELPEWKSPEKIIKLANLIVISRPGFDFPAGVDDLPEFVQEQVGDYDFNFIELKTEKSIQFVRVKDIDISSTVLRKLIRSNRTVEKFIPLSVENYIKEQKIYQRTGDKIPDYKEFSRYCAQALFDKKGIAVRGFDLRKMDSPSDFSLVASGTSTRHASALAENLMKAVKEEFNVFPQSLEGIDEGRWIVIDYGNLIIHIFYDFVRGEYRIEDLWREGVDLKFTDATPAPLKP
jgi:nicotinate-nucleotide adenylyltransferase